MIRNNSLSPTTASALAPKGDTQSLLHSCIPRCYCLSVVTGYVLLGSSQPIIPLFEHKANMPLKIFFFNASSRNTTSPQDSFGLVVTRVLNGWDAAALESCNRVEVGESSRWNSEFFPSHLSKITRSQDSKEGAFDCS